MIDPTQIPGYGIDANPAHRPGVPKKERSIDTPVFGTAQPPAGLAGAIRRYAYKFPDHWMRHWSTLLFADRVDVWEHRAQRMRGLLPVIALVTGGLLVKSLLRRRPTSIPTPTFEPVKEEHPQLAELYLDAAPSS